MKRAGRTGYQRDTNSKSSECSFREIARRVSANDLWSTDDSRPEVALTIGLPGGMTVTCRVDRIDVFPNGDCVIVDYKSSKTENVRETRYQPHAPAGAALRFGRAGAV